MRPILMMAILLCCSGLAGCNKHSSGPIENKVGTEKAQEQAPSAASIAEFLSTGNYEKAAEAAKAAIADDPHNPELHLLLARAQARMQNVGEAVAALQTSFDAGFHDPRGALNHPDFDGVRTNPVFSQFAAKFQRKPATAVSRRDSQPASSVTAGDVSIVEDKDGHARIRAGDIWIKD